MNWLRGKRTYLGLAAATIYGALVYLGITDSNEAVWGLILLWTGVSYRAALN